MPVAKSGGRHVAEPPVRTAYSPPLFAGAALWSAFLFVLIFAPLTVLILHIDPSDSTSIRISLYAAFVATPLLIVTSIMTARIGTLVAAYGIGGSYKAHRFFGMAVFVLVTAHLVTVVIGDPRHWHVFVLTDQPRQVTAGFVAYAAIIALSLSAILRSRRVPRYEGWRLVHIALTIVILVCTFLHVVWLHEYTIVRSMMIVYASLLLIIAVVVIKRWLWTPLSMYRHAHVVESVESLPGHAIRLVLTTEREWTFEAGQFVWLKIGSSPFVFEDHPFSISSASGDTRSKELIVRALGDFTDLLVALRPGRRIYLDGPYGRFTVNKIGRSAGLVFIGSGVGITPILSILRTLADRSYGHVITLIMGVRSVDTSIAMDAITDLQSRLDMHPVVFSEQAFDIPPYPPGWRGEVGVIGIRTLDPYLPKIGMIFHDYFVCGPPLMVGTVYRSLRERGIPARRIHTEQFGVI